MQALKGLVVGMAVLIVGGMILLVYGLYQKSQDPSFSFFGKGTTAAAPAAPTIAKSFGSLPLALPAGTSVRGIYPADGRLVVHAAAPGEPERLLVLDPTNGALIGQWTLGPPP